MSYQVNSPHSVTLRPNGPALYAKPPKPINDLGYIMDSPTFRVTTGDPGLDNMIKFGFWFGMAAALYKLYGMLRYNDPLFSPGTPPAWKMNARRPLEEMEALKGFVLAAYEPEMNVSELARATGVTRKTITDWLKEEGVYVAGKRGHCPGQCPAKKEAVLSGKKLADKQNILAHYKPGMNVSDLAREFGVHIKTAIRWLRDEGVYVPGKRGPLRDETLYDKVLKLYRPGEPVRPVAEAVGVSIPTVIIWTKEAGVYESRSRRPTMEEKHQALLMYRPGEPIGPVAEAVGVDPTTVVRWMKEAGFYEPAPRGRRKQEMNPREGYTDENLRDRVRG